MSTVNRVFIVGNVGNDPELKQLGPDTKVCSFSVATEYQGKGASKTSWHRVSAWGTTAEACGKYLKKGSKVCIEGRIDYSEKELNGVKTYFTNIVAEKVTFLSSIAKDESQQSFTPRPQPNKMQPVKVTPQQSFDWGNNNDADIPF